MTKHINGRATGRSQVVRVRGLGFSHTLCLCLWLYGFAPGDSVLSLSPAHTPHSPVSLSAIARAQAQHLPGAQASRACSGQQAAQSSCCSTCRPTCSTVSGGPAAIELEGCGWARLGAAGGTRLSRGRAARRLLLGSVRQPRQFGRPRKRDPEIPGWRDPPAQPH